MKPPTCRSCGVEEWRHVCKGVATERVKEKAEVPKPKRKGASK